MFTSLITTTTTTTALRFLALLHFDVFTISAVKILILYSLTATLVGAIFTAKSETKT